MVKSLTWCHCFYMNSWSFVKEAGSERPSADARRWACWIGLVAVHEALKVLSQSVQVLASHKGFCERQVPHRCDCWTACKPNLLSN